jgi:hypothetical protein
MWWFYAVAKKNKEPRFAGLKEDEWEKTVRRF